MKEIPELTDTQIMLIMKNALDYNAEVVKACSFIYGQDLKPNVRKRIHSDFKKLVRDYAKNLEAILDESES